MENFTRKQRSHSESNTNCPLSLCSSRTMFPIRQFGMLNVARRARSSSQNTNKQSNFFQHFCCVVIHSHTVLSLPFFFFFFCSTPFGSCHMDDMILFRVSRYLFIVRSLSPFHVAPRMSFNDPEGNYNLYAFVFFFSLCVKRVVI